MTGCLCDFYLMYVAIAKREGVSEASTNVASQKKEQMGYGLNLSSGPKKCLDQLFHFISFCSSAEVSQNTRLSALHWKLV